MPNHHLSFRRRSSQRGAVLVQFALLGAALVAILGIVQIGYMYYAKRDLQRIADLAALEAVNTLTYGDASTCPAAMAAGDQSITAQLRLTLNNEVRQIACGHWDGSLPDAQRFSTSYGPQPSAALNSAQVTLQGQTLQLLPFTGTPLVAATAIAAKDSQPVASFQVGSQLLRFDNSRLLGKIAAPLGLDITRLTVLDKNGIANAKITPAGLLQFLGLPVGVNDLALLKPSDLANINASLLDLIDASINAAGNSLLNAAVDVGALQALRAYLASSPIANIRVPLGGPNGIFATIAAGRNGAIGPGLDTILDVADLVRTHLVIANGKNALALNLIGVPGLVTAQLTVVEPPTIGIGPANGTIKARSAQVRLGLTLGGNGTNNSNPLLGLLGVHLNIPVQVDVVRSTGTLEAIQCNASTRSRVANISVHSAVADVCIGTLDSNGTCHAADLVSVDLLNILGGLTINAGKSVSILGSSSSSLSHPPNAQQCPFNGSDECLIGMHVGDKTMSGPNGLRLGSTISGLLGTITGLVADVANAKVNGLLGAVLQPILWLLGGLQVILNLVVSVVSSLLTPVLNALGGVLDTLLAPILGVEVGRAEVELLGIQCDTAQLVN